MMTSNRRFRRNLAAGMAVVMMLTALVALPTPASATVLQSAGKLAKSGVQLAGALAATYMGGVLGMALLCNPIGMVLGGVAGYWLGKKVMNWTTASGANFATVLGAIAGGALCFGAGLPLLGIGIVGGAVIGRGLAWAFSKIGGLFKRKPKAEASKEAQAQNLLNEIQQTPAVVTPAAPTTPTPAAAPKAAPPPMDAQAAYQKYMAAFKLYMDATTKGDSGAAQSAYAEYQKYLTIYQEAMKASGK